MNNQRHICFSGLGGKGPSQIVDWDHMKGDFIRGFPVRNWPDEAKSWLTRNTAWPSNKLKHDIIRKGYLLVPTGNPTSPEKHLEWRCSFSVAEKMLFQSLGRIQIYIFLLFKVLIKEYLPGCVNWDGEREIISTYQLKTVFLWYLEDNEYNWEPENMLQVL